MEVLLGKSLINGPFSIAMFDYRRVIMVNHGKKIHGESWLDWQIMVRILVNSRDD